MIITVIVDKQLCIGSQTCVIEDEDHFVMDKDDRALVRKDKQSEGQREIEFEVSEEQKQQFIRIAKLCPTRAIIVLDENRQQLFPKL